VPHIKAIWVLKQKIQESPIARATVLSPMNLFSKFGNGEVAIVSSGVLKVIIQI